MSLLDVNALVALAWDTHIHHVVIRRWFETNHAEGWQTCPLTESGFVRISANRKAMAEAIAVEHARGVLAALRGIDGHSFLADDVSIAADDVPPLTGHRQVTDAHLLTLARRRGVAVVTFDSGLAALAEGRDIELLTVLGD